MRPQRGAHKDESQSSSSGKVCQPRKLDRIDWRTTDQSSWLERRSKHLCIETIGAVFLTETVPKVERNGGSVTNGLERVWGGTARVYNHVRRGEA